MAFANQQNVMERLGEVDKDVRQRLRVLSALNGIESSLSFKKSESQLDPLIHAEPIAIAPKYLYSVDSLYSDGHKLIEFDMNNYLSASSGKCHILMLSASGDVFFSGEGKYASLRRSDKEVQATLSNMRHISAVSPAALICTSAFASFALVAVSRHGKPHRCIRHPTGTIVKEENPIYQLFSWGRGSRGILGNGTTKSSTTPKTVTFFDKIHIHTMTAGFEHVLVLTATGTVYGFGANSHGQLGIGTSQDQHTPVRISELTRVIEITAGDFHSLAIATDADLLPQVFSWGCGKNGRLGHNDVNDRLHPTLIDTFCDKKIVSISAGGAHSLARSGRAYHPILLHSTLFTLSGSHVWSWGCGTHGQLGHYNSWDCLKPKIVRELTGEMIEYIDAGERHSLALSVKGELWLWGFGIPPQKCCKQNCDCVHATLYPQKMNTKSSKIERALAGRGQTFVGTSLSALGYSQFRTAN